MALSSLVRELEKLFEFPQQQSKQQRAPRKQRPVEAGRNCDKGNQPGSVSGSQPQVESPYLTAREAAAYLKVSYGTFRNWATQVKKTRTGRYTRESLDYFALHRRK